MQQYRRARPSPCLLGNVGMLTGQAWERGAPSSLPRGSCGRLRPAGQTGGQGCALASPRVGALFMGPSPPGHSSRPWHLAPGPPSVATPLLCPGAGLAGKREVSPCGHPPVGLGPCLCSMGTFWVSPAPPRGSDSLVTAGGAGKLIAWPHPGSRGPSVQPRAAVTRPGGGGDRA